MVLTSELDTIDDFQALGEATSKAFFRQHRPHMQWLIGLDVKDVVRRSGDEECTNKLHVEHVASSAVSVRVRLVASRDFCPLRNSRLLHLAKAALCTRQLPKNDAAYQGYADLGSNDLPENFKSG